MSQGVEKFASYRLGLVWIFWNERSWTKIADEHDQQDLLLLSTGGRHKLFPSARSMGSSCRGVAGPHHIPNSIKKKKGRHNGNKRENKLVEKSLQRGW